jgi:predicted Zn-dependent protease
MSDSGKPREFWVENPSGEGISIAWVSAGKSATKHMLHVIEKSAYDALERENARLKAALREILKEVGTSTLTNKIAVRALGIESEVDHARLQEAVRNSGPLDTGDDEVLDGDGYKPWGG